MTKPTRSHEGPTRRQVVPVMGASGSQIAAEQANPLTPISWQLVLNLNGAKQALSVDEQEDQARRSSHRIVNIPMTDFG
jgi:hypothetical protein